MSKFYVENLGCNEVLRLKQVIGIAELFESQDFSEAWEPE